MRRQPPFVFRAMQEQKTALLDNPTRNMARIGNDCCMYGGTRRVVRQNSFFFRFDFL